MHIPLSSISEQDLLADVTSFTNASGGYIIFGIKEEGGVHVDSYGLKKINPDQETARLENIMCWYISPHRRKRNYTD